MTVSYIRKIDGESAGVNPIELYQESGHDQQLRRCTQWALEQRLIHGDSALMVQELNAPEDVLRTHNRAWYNNIIRNTWAASTRYVEWEGHMANAEGVQQMLAQRQPAEKLSPDVTRMVRFGDGYVPDGDASPILTDEKYEEEFQWCVRTGLYLSGHTHVAIVPVEQHGFGRELFNEYTKGTRYDETQETDYWTPRPTLDGYEPFSEPEELDRDEYSAAERFDAWLRGGHPHNQRMSDYYRMEERLRRAHLERERRRLVHTHAGEMEVRDAKRGEENPDGLVGFTEIVVTPDEVFDEMGELMPSDEVMLYLVSGYTVIVKEPGQQQHGWRRLLGRKDEQTTMLIPLTASEMEAIKGEAEI